MSAVLRWDIDRFEENKQISFKKCVEPDDCENDNKIILPPLFKFLSIRKGIQETS